MLLGVDGADPMLRSTIHIMQKEPVGTLLRRGLWAVLRGEVILMNPLSSSIWAPCLPVRWGLGDKWPPLLLLCHSGTGQVFYHFNLSRLEHPRKPGLRSDLNKVCVAWK